MRVLLILRGADHQELTARPRQKWSLYCNPPAIKHVLLENASFSSVILAAIIHYLVRGFPIAMFDGGRVKWFQNGFVPGCPPFTVADMNSCNFCRKRWKKQCRKKGHWWWSLWRCWARWTLQLTRASTHGVMCLIAQDHAALAGVVRDPGKRLGADLRAVSRGYHLVLKGTSTASHLFVTPRYRVNGGKTIINHPPNHMK